MKTVTATVAGVLMLGGAAVAQTPISDTPATDIAALGVTTELDLSGRGLGVGGAFNNTLVSNFADTAPIPGGPFVVGVLTSEVFANVSVPGTSLTDVVIRYTFTNTGQDNIDAFDFGVDGNAALDTADILRAEHGTLTSGVTPGQVSPLVSIDEFPVNGNPVWKFDFQNAGGLTSQLEPGETFTWYVKSDGANAVGLVDVVVQNAFPANAKALAFVDSNAGQPDLDVPTPGAVALGVLGVAFASRRRRG